MFTTAATSAALLQGLDMQKFKKKMEKENPQNRSVNFDRTSDPFMYQTAKQRMRGLSSKQKSVMQTLGLLLF